MHKQCVPGCFFFPAPQEPGNEAKRMVTGPKILIPVLTTKFNARILPVIVIIAI